LTHSPNPEPRAPVRLRWRHKLVMIAFGLLISALVVDALARTFHLIPRPGNADYQAISRRVGVMLPPYDRFTTRGFVRGNTEFKVDVRLNALGLRGPDIEPEPPDGATRIVAIGDSYTAGWEVPLDEGWTAWLADRLSAGDRRVDVVNLGSPGFGTDREYLLYEAYGSTLDADIVLLVMFVENDIGDNAIAQWEPPELLAQTRPFFTLDESGALVEHPWDYVDKTRPYLVQPFPENVIGWLNAHSITYRVLRDAPRRVRDALTGGDDDGDSEDGARGPRLPAADVLSTPLEVFFTEPDDAWQAAWRLTEALLVAFRDAVTEDGAEFVVAIVPPHMIVQYDDWRYEPALEEAGREWDLWYPQQRMLALLDRLDIAVINPTDLFIDFHEQTGQHAYYVLDRHFNPTGTCLFGTALANELAARGYVDAPPDIPVDPLAACGSG